MATRETILKTVTTALRDDFQNVVNRFETITDLTNEPGDANKWPHLNVTMAPHGSSLTLDGTKENELLIPISIVGYAIAQSVEDLQIEIAKLMDQITASLTALAHVNLYCTNGFGIVRYDVIPAEDEQHHEVGIALVRAVFVTGDIG